jgi:hypothetical protein
MQKLMCQKNHICHNEGVAEATVAGLAYSGATSPFNLMPETFGG